MPHVGKSLKAGFSNWYLKVGNERSNLAVIRSLRNRSTDNTKQFPASVLFREKCILFPPLALKWSTKKVLFSLFVWLTVHEMVAIHSKSEKEATTSSSVIHRTARYTRTPSSHLLWKILLVVITKRAWTALLLNAALDSHSESTSNLTMLSTQRTQCQELLALYLPLLTLSNS